MMRRVKYIILYLFIISAGSEAGAYNIDSLLQKFDSSKSRQEKITVANNFFVLLHNEEFTEKLIQFNSKSN